jgi:hypothetical protein
VVYDRWRITHPHGVPPLSTVLYLKQVEAPARGERIAASAVTADVGNVAACLPAQEHRFIKANPVDVEDWGVTLTFSDGTKSTVFSGDIIMGGVRNVVETYTTAERCSPTSRPTIT